MRFSAARRPWGRPLLNRDETENLPNLYEHTPRWTDGSHQEALLVGMPTAVPVNFCDYALHHVDKLSSATPCTPCAHQDFRLSVTGQHALFCLSQETHVAQHDTALSDERPSTSPSSTDAACSPSMVSSIFSTSLRSVGNPPLTRLIAHRRRAFIGFEFDSTRGYPGEGPPAVRRSARLAGLQPAVQAAFDQAGAHWLAAAQPAAPVRHLPPRSRSTTRGCASGRAARPREQRMRVSGERRAQRAGRVAGRGVGTRVSGALRVHVERVPRRVS